MPQPFVRCHSCFVISSYIPEQPGRRGCAAPALSQSTRLRSARRHDRPSGHIVSELMLLPKEGGYVPNSRKPGTSRGVFSLVCIMRRSAAVVARSLPPRAPSPSFESLSPTPHRLAKSPGSRAAKPRPHFRTESLEYAAFPPHEHR